MRLQGSCVNWREGRQREGGCLVRNTNPDDFQGLHHEEIGPIAIRDGLSPPREKVAACAASLARVGSSWGRAAQ